MKQRYVKHHEIKCYLPYAIVIPDIFIQLFIGSSASDTCTSLVSNITFTDDAIKSILDYSSQIPQNGTFEAAENIKSHFGGTPVNGQWLLSIFDQHIDDTIGRLLDWKLHFQVEHCSEDILWNKLSTNSNSCEESMIVDGYIEYKNCTSDCGRHLFQNEEFKPRYSHTSIAIGNNVFVLGGHSHTVMSEIWRFNYESKDWVQLHYNKKRQKFHGQAAALTPFGMITIGGFRNGISNTSFTNSALIYDVFDQTETIIDVQFK